VQQRVAYFEPIAHAKRVSIATHVEPSFIVANERHIIRVIDNLLSNGIKYNKTGGTIDIVVQANMMKISDTGIGFDQSEADSIFVRYKRLDSANGGFGLGLNIVETICNDYGISISVQSAINSGSQFSLSWESEERSS
jgi:two-component system OmpR family sensor kinase